MPPVVEDATTLWVGRRGIDDVGWQKTFVVRSRRHSFEKGVVIVSRTARFRGGGDHPAQRIAIDDIAVRLFDDAWQMAKKRRGGRSIDARTTPVKKKSSSSPMTGDYRPPFGPTNGGG